MFKIEGDMLCMDEEKNNARGKILFLETIPGVCMENLSKNIVLNSLFYFGTVYYLSK